MWRDALSGPFTGSRKGTWSRIDQSITAAVQFSRLRLRPPNLLRDALRAGLAAPARNESGLHTGMPARGDHEKILLPFHQRMERSLIFRADLTGQQIGAFELGYRCLRIFEAVTLNIFARPAGFFHDCLMLACEHQRVLRL